MKTGLREYFCQGSFLAKGGAATSDEFSVKFQRGGRGSFSIQNIILQIFGTLNRAF